MRKFLPLIELATVCFFAAETDGLSILIELPVRNIEPVATEPDGLSILIELPMRDLELRAPLLLLEPMPDLVEMDTDGVLPLIELPRRDLEPVADCLLGTDTDGDLLPIELPIREVLPELARALEFAVGCLLEADADEFRVLIELPIRDLELVLIELPMRDLLELMLVDPREVEERDGREMVTRLDVDPLWLRLDVTRLGLLLDVVVRERLGVGALLAEILLELLRLEVLDLVGVRTDRELTLLLRLLPELAEALDLGAGADLETCDLLLLDPPLLLLFAAKTGSAASAKIKTKAHKHNRKEA